MKKGLPAVTAALALSVTSAVAADLPSQKAPPPVYVPPPPPILWTGFYGGLNLGGGWTSSNNNNNVLPFVDPGLPIGSQQVWPGVGLFPNLLFLPGNNVSSSAGGVVGGGQVGYNYQFGTSIVIGAEADIQGTSISSNNGNYLTAYPSPFAATLGSAGILVPLAAGVGPAAVPWFGTVRGRAGWLITPTLLLYGTGGFAYGGVDFGLGGSTGAGWTAGGGVEWMFMPHWSAKAEYLYVSLSSNGWNNNAWGLGFPSTAQLNVVRAGVNYHFNWGAPAPVVGKF